MTKAEAMVRHAIVNALVSTTGFTGLRAGPAVDRLVDALLSSLLDPQVTQAIRDLAAGPDAQD